uniref:Homeobox domain-containing protein n=1 Tax=Zea mays TaxID=4577 RepID=C4J597_MAIZE|nr:unknown [Zea mays]
MMERVEDLGLSLSLSSSLASPRTHHVATMLLRAPEKRFLEMPLLLPAKRTTEVTGEDGLRGGSDEEDGGCGIDGSRKKLRLSKDQSAVLEDSFREHPTLNPRQKAALAQQLGLRPRQVEVWFQNRRARYVRSAHAICRRALARVC